MGDLKPFNSCAPRLSISKDCPASRRVLSATTIWPGAAALCRRAARLGVSPAIEARSFALLPAMSPTTTCPDAMPIRAFNCWPSRRLKVLDCSERLEACPNGTLGMVLVSHGPSKICKHAVSEIFGDIAAKARDRASDAILIAAGQFVHVFRVELRR